ncbi:MAG: AmmeMemoRadiSam system protein B [Gammaproteobacteria bacterium]|nr:AmmeMemoRadiSam system protein B [Gammaproteobacteria bacterium]
MLSRPPAVAGTFYPENPQVLADCVETLLAQNPTEVTVKAPKILIAPHAGYVYSGPVAACAYNSLQPSANVIQRVILLGPAHHVPLQGIALPKCDAFSTPLGEIPIDLDLVERLKKYPYVTEAEQAHRFEHSLEVHLPFLQSVLTKFTLVPLAVGSIPPQQVAEALNAIWGEQETVIVASSDLSHYRDYETARQFDQLTSNTILKLDASLKGEQACGCYAINGIINAAKQRNMRAIQLDLRNSGDTAGPKDRVVGYGAYAFYGA